MSTATAARHTFAELRYHACDEITGIATFVADSASTPGKLNTTALDTTSGATLCDCRGAECGHDCWHQDLIAAAWLAAPAMRDMRWLSDAQLRRYGCKHAAMVAAYRTRCGRVLLADALNLIAARAEWRRRVAPATFPIVDALPQAA
jgi:hypothetical protein